MHQICITTIEYEFRTEEHLRCYRSIFGNSSTFGLRKKNAEVGTVNHLRVNDKFNVIGNRNEGEEGDMNESLIKITYDGSFLTCKLSYRMYIYDGNNRNNNNCPCNHLQSVLAPNNVAQRARAAASITNIVPGKRFQHKNTVYRVLMTSATEIKCEVSEPRCESGTEWTFDDVTYVSQQIRNFN